MTNLHPVDIAEAKRTFCSASSALELSPSSDSDSVLHIGIIGCGRIGQLHASNIVRNIPDAKLVCVSDVFESAARKVADRHDVPMACTEAKDLVNNPAVQAVIVCSPTDTHAEIIRQAAAAGKHIFCEKPVDQSLDVINDLKKVVDEAGVKFFLGFQRRFDKHFLRAKQSMDTGSLGKPLKLHLVSRDPSPPPVGYLKQSGGLFLDMSSHDFDMARFLVGSNISEVTAFGLQHNEEIGAIGDYDHTLCSIRFENGCMGTIDNSRACSLGYDQRAELFGTDGNVHVENVLPTMVDYTDSNGYHADPPLNFFMERYADAYVEEMKSFVDVVLNGKPVPVGIEDGRLTIIYAAAAMVSMKEKRTVLISEMDVPSGKVADISEAKARI